MNINTKNTIYYTLFFAATVVAGFLMYKKYVHGPNNASKQEQVLYIIEFSGGKGDYSSLIPLDDAYISAWYEALRNKLPSFTISGKTFTTQTGKQIG